MFETIVAKLTTTVRAVVDAVLITAGTRPWLVPLAILALFIVL